MTAPALSPAARRREAKAAALEAIEYQRKAGALTIRQATPEEREALGINAYQERLRCELAEREEERRRVEEEKRAERERRAALRLAPPPPTDPALVERLRAARRAEQDAPGQLNALIAQALDAGSLSTPKIATIVGISTSGVSDRAARARRDGVVRSGPVGESVLRDARARELDTPHELDLMMAEAAGAGMTSHQIGEVIGLSAASVPRRLRDARRRAA